MRNGIHDQRDIHHAHSVDGQRDFWIMFLRDRRGGLTPTMDARHVYAHVSDGRWVANCPQCNGGIACWDENPHGCCLDCGHVYPVRWPDRYREVEADLGTRANPFNRHWHPHLGEPPEKIFLETRAMREHERGAVAIREANRNGIPAVELAHALAIPVIDVSSGTPQLVDPPRRAIDDGS